MSSSPSSSSPSSRQAGGDAPPQTSSRQALLSGAVAGVIVDFTLYPFDTIKTRLQSKQGFWAAGGFKGIYRGVGSVGVGSAPGAAFFFVSYEFLKSRLPQICRPLTDPSKTPILHMVSASGAEVVSCLIRVPTEVVKSRQQTSSYGADTTTARAFVTVLKEEGPRGLYKGFGSTIAREIPFTCLQFPLYENLKLRLARRRGLRSTGELAPWESGLCGSVAGGVAAATTTPLDVVKTRIMLEKHVPDHNGTSGPAEAMTKPRASRMVTMLIQIYREEGAKALFRGVVPRVSAISLGGAVFLGAYEAAKKALQGMGI